MAFIVEMLHRKEDCPEPRFYSCHRDKWKQLLTLAETFGWQPSGSVKANDIDHPTNDYDKHFKPTYDPEEWAYWKAVYKEDAKNIAIALLKADDAIKSGNVAILPKAKSTIFKNSLSKEEFQSNNSSIGQQILKFGLFASQGGFLFSLDD
jgi:hypothetical protein